jgi:hypothetical protein
LSINEEKVEMSSEETTQLEAAVEERQAESGKKTRSIELFGRSWALVPKLPVFASVELDAAAKSDDLERLVRAFAFVVAKADREAFIESAFSEPDNPDDYVSVEELVERFGDAMEIIAGRPLAK